MQDHGSGYGTGFSACKAEKDSGGKGKSCLRGGAVGGGKQQGIQEYSTRGRQELQAALIYESPVYDFFRERAEYAKQKEPGNPGHNLRRFPETETVQKSAGDSGCEP